LVDQPIADVVQPINFGAQLQPAGIALLDRGEAGVDISGQLGWN
jgi:hypothetical protein